MTTTVTLTNVSALTSIATGGTRPHDQLVRITTADAIGIPPSRHLLDAIDEVHFHRGPIAAVRRASGDRRVLDISVPDPWMSNRHGRLVRGATGWSLHDPVSKNGAVVDGARTRLAPIADGDTFELGHTLFMFRRADIEPAATCDSIAGAGAVCPLLATFVGPLALTFERLAAIAATRVSVLILGETGTGKEVIARAVHELSARSGPFVAVNCGALPASLIEAELFGHRRGAFTGATQDRPGLIRSAHGGTLFLDEIAELPQASQVALLRVLQEREVVPVGDDRPVEVDVRLCAATLQALPALVDRGLFRRDLYARLLGFTVELPPLRDRIVDLGIVLRALGAPRLAMPALRALVAYDWPLNIRELEKTVESAAALAGGEPIHADQLDLVKRAPSSAIDDDDEALRDRLVDLLTNHGGNVMAVSRILGVARTQIYRWAAQLDLDVAKYRRQARLQAG